MTHEISRRTLLAGLAALGLQLPRSAAWAAETDLLKFSEPAEPFTFAGLIQKAKDMSSSPYVPTPVRADAALEQIDFDKHWQIRFRPDHTLMASDGKAPIRFFHLGRYFKQPVGIHVIEADHARTLLYSPDFFEVPAGNPAEGLPQDIGFAGFRIMDPDATPERDWIAFLGGVYFRSSGELDQYGQSARAVTVNCAMPEPEEFPRFTDFYFAPSENGTVVVYCLVDGESITGAVKMDLNREDKVIIDISANFFARRDIGRVGLAALTSMFWYSETEREQAVDWRPEIHDTDGLAIWTGSGERLWRPLNNPPRVMTSSFLDSDPRGFGLLQRDRSFENYQDDGVFYEKRPSVWIEPKGSWGPGSVQLVEIPTDDEIHDNIVAHWVPEKPVRAGDALSLDYRLHWVDREPYPPTNAVVVSSRLGTGGVPGQPRPKGVWKFVIDFEGGTVGDLGQDDKVEAVVAASSGEISGIYTLPVVGTKRWRAVFDLKPFGLDPIELRAYLKQGDTALTETWLYQFHPETPARKLAVLMEEKPEEPKQQQ